MTKTIVVLFALFVACTVNAGKEVTEKLEEQADIAENSKTDDDEDESESIQIVHRDVVTDKAQKEAQNDLNDDIPHEESSEVLKENNSTQVYVNNDNFFEDYVSDSDDIILENPDDKIVEVLLPSDSSIEENNDSSNRQEELEIVIEQITKANNDDENNQEDSSALKENENNWKSAENVQSDKEYSNDGANEEISNEDEDRDYSVEDYMDKNMGLKLRMDTRNPGRREHYKRPIDARHYGPPDEHILDTGPIRNFGEIVVPRLRPTLTRNGIVLTPTLVTVQTGSPLLGHLAGHNWIQNRAHMNPDGDFHTRSHHNRVIGLPQPQPQYEESKMIDDYNDYGTNTYSYTPVMKATTEAPASKFNIFQKLVEASNNPKIGTGAFNDNIPGNFYPQRQYAESYGPYDVRRFRRNAWDGPLFEDI